MQILAAIALAAALAIAGSGAAGARPAPTAAADLTTAATESLMAQTLNADRAAAGLVAVRVDARLTAIARARSADMAARHYFGHTQPDGRTVFGILTGEAIKWYGAGEIIAWNTWPAMADSVTTANDMWLNSPTHRSIIMATSYNYMGVGLAIDGSGKKYWTTVFIKGPDEPIGEPTPQPTPQEAFAPIRLSGRGSKVPKFTIPENTAALATISETGTSNFVVWTLGSDGSTQELLVNEIGKYKGTVLFDADAGSHSVAFKIQSNGSWTIAIAPLTRARRWDTSKTLTGRGDDVVQLSRPVSGLMTTTVTHRGRSNFAAHSYSDSGIDLLVNESGNHKGEIQLPDGTLLLQIEADGTWSFTAPQ